MRYCLLVAVILFFHSFSAAQNTAGNGLQEVLQKLETYHNDFPQEKVYLHLDKPYYTVGDDIWFKAYVTVGQLNFLSGLSKILYVELLGPENNIVRSLRLPLVSGLTMGDFKLTDSLEEGNYRIRAYTNWMRNFDEDFFDRTITIGNTLSDNLVTHSEFTYDESADKNEVRAAILITDLDGHPLSNSEVSYEVELETRTAGRGKDRTGDDGKLQLNFTNKQLFNLKTGQIKLNIKLGDGRIIRKVIPIKRTGNSSTIQFFPESGILLAGTMNKLGFKAVGADGRGREASGYIVDATGTKLTDFKTDHAGMGNISLLPEAGKAYKAVVTFLPDSIEKQVDLPTVENAGYTLAVSNSLKKNIYLQISTTEAAAKGQTLSVIAQKDGQVFYAVRLKQVRNETGLSITRDKLPSGVIQFTLFDEQMKPVAERLVFNFTDLEKLPVDVHLNKQTYHPKEKVSVTLTAGTDSDSARIGSFSVAITDLGKVPVDDDTEANILAALLLSAELKGYIENPGYYFNEMNDLKMRQLDNLMLTQGWRRIVWSNIMNDNNTHPTYKPEQAIRISGTVVRRNGKPVPNAKVTVLSTSDIGAVIDTVADAEGRFNFDRLIFYDSTKFVVQARDERGKRNVEIQMDEVPRQVIGKNKNSPDLSVDVNQSINTYLKSSREQFTELEKYGLMGRSYLLQEVKVTAKEKPKVTQSSNLNGAGNADQVITAEDLSSCPTLDMCLQGRLTGVIFKNGVPYSTRSQNTPMQIIVDGMYMEADALSMISPFDVASIEVLRSIGNTAIYGMMGGGGVLIITTKRGNGDYSQDLYVPGIVTYSPQGYYSIRQFTAPDYSKPQENAGMQDLRTTIFWKPNLVTNEAGNVSFDFYTAATPGRYRVVVEGIDASGRLARSVSYIQVEE